jgi:hypothetical protein
MLVLGDSRAAADVLPNRLGIRAVNLAVGGGSSVEAYYMLARALRCEDRPGRIVLSLNAGHLSQPDTFWQRSVRFGLLDHDDLTDFLNSATRLGDRSLAGENGDGLPGRLRAWLYAVRFPSFYFGNLLSGGVMLRYWSNRQALAAALDTHGQYFFGVDSGSSAVAMEGRMRGFAPAPILDDYLDRTLSLAERFGIPVDFVPMPLNQSTWRSTDPAMRAAFGGYLAQVAARHPGFHAPIEAMPHWPDRWFGDRFAHLNPAGAQLLSDRLAACLRSGGELAGCNLRWSDEMATGPLE